MKTHLYFEVIAYDAVKNAVEFNRSTHQVTDLYAKALNLSVKGINKISIELSETKEFTFTPPSKMFPFVLINKKFDFDTYWSLNEQDRKLRILEILQESVVEMCSKLNLDVSPFELAYQKVKTLNT